MEKVKISREVADAIEENLNYLPIEEIIKISIKNGWREKSIGRHLNSKNIDLETLFKALYIGYEVEKAVEKTPKEELFEIYKKNEYLTSVLHSKNYFGYVNEGIFLTLDTLGIKIKGINE